MKKRKINVFVLGAVVLTLALFGCSSGNVADTTAPGAAAIDGVALYTSDCSGCHGSLAASGKKGATVAQIQNAIAHNWGGMGAFAGLTTDQLQAIATALAPVTTTNTPATAASLDGVALYADNCSSCHGPLATSGKGGVLASAIQTAIANNFGGMGRFSNLTTAQLQAIADALATVQAQNPVQTPPPGSSLDGAALYAAYCSSCHGALATSSKKGATTSRIQAGVANVGAMRSLSSLSVAQIDAIATALGAGSSSTPPPLPAPSVTDGAALYTQYCSSCHGALATSSKKGATASQIQNGISGNYGGMGQFSNLTATQIQAIAAALATTTPTPAPTDGATLYATYCSSCHGALTSSTKTGRTAAQITAAISSVSAMNSLSNLSATQIQAIASVLATSTPTPAPAPTDGAALYTTYCSSCHGSLAASSKVGRTAAQITAAITSVSSMNSLSSLTSTQIQAIASALATAPTPAPTDGAALYTTYCSSCHGALASSSVRGSSANTISSALSGVSQMRSISLTSTQIQAIATALGTTATTSPTPTTTTTDGATLYGTYCASCHGPLATSTKSGATATRIQTGISTVSAMSSLSFLTSTQIQAIAAALSTGTAPTTTTPVCGSCHAIPPSTGHHTYHVSSRGLSCSTCHGTGYSSTTVNTATHNNGTVNMTTTIGWNPSTRTCSNSCHSTERW